MRRLLLGLPLCLLMAPSLAQRIDSPRPVEPQAPVTIPTPAADALPDAATMERLAQTDPVGFLRACLRYYERNVSSYHLVMQKQERLGGELRSPEEIEVWFRDRPYAVHLNWLKGARLAQRALYVDGMHDGQMLVSPAGWRRIAGIVARDPEGPDARQSGRFSLKQYGLKNGLLRALDPWQTARDKGQLYVECLGGRPLEAIGGRRCLGLHRSRFAEPENDGVTDQTLWFDCETWLLAGSIARDDQGQVVGEYYFRDVQLNETFANDPFRREALK